MFSDIYLRQTVTGILLYVAMICLIMLVIGAFGPRPRK